MPINYKDYHPAFKFVSFCIRYIRAEDRCEWCRTENGKPHPIFGGKVKTQCVHLVDKDPMNIDPDNLAALCQFCHLNLDVWQHVDSKKYGSDYKGEHQLKLSFDDTELISTKGKAFYMLPPPPQVDDEDLGTNRTEDQQLKLPL